MSKHKPISDDLRAEIQAGKFAANARLPSEEALCRRWKVSRPTVARALRDLQLEGIIERRVGAGTFVRGEIRPQNKLIGLLTNGLGKTEILDPICAEITRAAQQRNCSVLTGCLSADHPPAELASQWASGGVRGVVFAPSEYIEGRQAFNMAVVTSFRRVNIPVVLVDRDTSNFPQCRDLDLVEMDNFQAGYEMGQHLASVGSRKIIFMARPCYPASTDPRLAGLDETQRRLRDPRPIRPALLQRLAGLTEALRCNGLPAPEFLVGEPSDKEILRRLSSDLEANDACICSNDLTAAILLQTAQSLGYGVPRDFLLAGFDDVSFATLLSVPLTTIRQPCRAIGIACVDALLERILHPRSPARAILLRGELVVRTSTTKSSDSSAENIFAHVDSLAAEGVGQPV